MYSDFKNGSWVRYLPFSKSEFCISISRYKKCEKCYRGLKDIRYAVSERTQVPGRIGTLCRELNMALTIIDWILVLQGLKSFKKILQHK